MNFLSHFYFTQPSGNPYYALGTILPDLCRNHDKSWKFHPEKLAEVPSYGPHLAALLEGWKLHILVDKIFHSSPSFVAHSAHLRSKLAPIFTRLPIRPFFLAHIGYELSLDSLLTRNRVVDTHLFYQYIANCDPVVTQGFLKRMGITETKPFLRYLNSFIENRYLENYNETKNIISSLDYIGSRVWQERFSAKEQNEAAIIFQDFLSTIDQSFMEVFEYIEKKISETVTNE